MILQGTLYSQALDMEIGAVFVAADDCGAVPPRKVAYLLHGLQGRYDDFLHYTVLPDLCRSYHCLFVLPDAQRSFYTDMACGNDYFTYLTRELPRLVSDLFRVSSAPEDTVILGASMGGFGALKAALTFPERYAACAAFSPCCLDLADYLRPAWRSGEEGDAFRRIFGDKLAADFLAAFGPDSPPPALHLLGQRGYLPGHQPPFPAANGGAGLARRVPGAAGSYAQLGVFQRGPQACAALLSGRSMIPNCNIIIE